MNMRPELRASHNISGLGIHTGAQAPTSGLFGPGAGRLQVRLTVIVGVQAKIRQDPPGSKLSHRIVAKSRHVEHVVVLECLRALLSDLRELCCRRPTRRSGRAGPTGSSRVPATWCRGRSTAPFLVIPLYDEDAS